LLLAFLAPLSRIEGFICWLGGYHYDPIRMAYYRFWYPRELRYKHWLLAPCEVLAAMVCLAVVFIDLPVWLVVATLAITLYTLYWSFSERSKNGRRRSQQNFHDDPRELPR
jgi:hypothetical protein